MIIVRQKKNMSDFKFNCPHCNQSLEASDDMSGLLVECPSCAKTIEVPFERQVQQQTIRKENSQHTKSCPCCGEQNSDLDTYCQKCGADLADTQEHQSSTRPCPYCGESILYSAQKCKHCGEFLNKSAMSRSTPKSGSQGKIAVTIVLVVAIIIVLGNFHLVKGASIIGFRLVSRLSFGFSEMVVDVDKITSMPLIAAQSRYPLGVKACQRAGFIETDEQFKKRSRKEFDDDFQKEYKKQMENVERETKRLIDSLNQ